ncbi:uncharacterized protein BO96DRAFT_227290 [Aspergillus niger CBS 101883]|uniref:uncharacterized protein n=1 Tax=Aspergillus lacticoffeatus (strain CBS 101883) TaxID=1450533 RepID=UPI000D800F93|nr:uncharacterized protein BO96DRAFT_227290 [Aspergillus niger CBS 101883]PYH58812.1 hypothetical protein BO96DRAFT_227290 [Aspergillus niger CBS 101883]
MEMAQAAEMPNGKGLVDDGLVCRIRLRKTVQTQPFPCAIPSTIPGWLIGQSDRRSTDPSTDPIPDPSPRDCNIHSRDRPSFAVFAFCATLFLRSRISHTDDTRKD